MKPKLFIYILFSLSISSIAQVVPNVDWVKYYSEKAQISNVPSAIDANSNVYITGYTYPTTVSADLTTIKYNATGAIVWVKNYDNGGFDNANAITLDATSNVYVTGESDGVGTGRDIITIKYDVNGNQLWASRFNGTANGADIANAIVTDASGNVYVTGQTTATAGAVNFVTIKYNASGVQQWTHTFNGTGNASDIAVAIDFSSTNRLFITGTSINASGNSDIVTIRINPNTGLQMWAKSINGSANNNDVSYALLSDGNDVVVVGSQNNTTTGDDYITLKYNGNNGNTLWLKNYDFANSSNKATAITKDATGNFAVTGIALNSSIVEYHTLKYTNSGVQLWVNAVTTGLNYSNTNPQIATDPIANHFYVCGQKNTNVSDIFVYQITPSGNKTWEQTVNGAMNNQDVAIDLVVNSAGVLYVAGASLNSNAKYDYTTVKITQTPVYFPIDYNNVPEAFSPTHLYYQNTGEVKDYSGAVVNDVLFYTKHASPKEFIFSNKIAFCLSKQDTSSNNPIDTMVRVDMVFNRAQEKQNVYPFEVQNNGVINYLLPSFGANGKTDVKGSSRLMVPNIYPNIDLHYYSNQKGLKYYFVVKPGGDPRLISLTFNGATSTNLNVSNDLQVQTKLGNFAFKKPNIYNVSFALTTPTVTGTNGWVNSALNTYTINTGTYNTLLPLVIEIDKGQALAAASPTANLTWSTYFGDINFDAIAKMKADVSKNLYVIGTSSSPHLPQGLGLTAIQVFQFTNKGSQDAFVAKFDSSGVLLWETYVGGSLQDVFRDFDIANNGSGDLYCVGQTASTDLFYKPKAGANLVNHPTHGAGNNFDGFIFQLGQNGKTCNWSTYYGGNNEDVFHACKFDPSGNFIIAGTSATSNLSVVGSAPTYTSNYIGAGYYDGYILKLNKTTFNIDWATYIGANTPTITQASDVNLYTLDINSFGDIFVGGQASNTSYPVVGTALNTHTYNAFYGVQDGVITRFNNSGQILWSTYIGSNGNDGVQSIKIDGNELYVGGYTDEFNSFITKTSTKFFNNTIKFASTPFPTDLNASAGFFMNFDIANNLVHSTLIGGNGSDAVNAIEVDSKHNVYLTGNTSSTNLDLPPSGNPIGSWSINNSGASDFYIFAMQPNGVTNPIWTTQIGGTSNEFSASGTYIDAKNNLYILGAPNSSVAFPWNDGGGFPVWYQGFLAGSAVSDRDGAITRLKLGQINGVGINEQTINNNGIVIYPNPTQNTLTIQLAHFEDKAIYTVYNNLGQIITNGSLLNNNTTINVADLSVGMYVIEITNKTTRLTTKFIKQ